MKHENKVAAAMAKELILQNKARWQAGLPLLAIRIRDCLGCGVQFESIGKFRCKYCINSETTTS